MRVYLADLCYLNDWDTNHPVPLNIGYVGAYLQSRRPADEIRLFKDPRQLIAELAASPPDVLALSHYDWNANLNLPVLARAKEQKPDVVTVMGGPNFHAADQAWASEFFARRPALEGYITGEGEQSFVRVIDLVDRHGAIAAVPWEARPASLFAYDRAEARIVHNPEHPVPRLDLSTVPSPYLNGMLDPFLADPRLAPIVETNRGCPYSCAYCCWGQATQSKINKFPIETVLQEIRHAARTTRNPTGFFYIADGNFGIFERDQEIAAALQECTNSHGVPKRVYVYFAKNTNDRVVGIAETLSSVTMLSMSKQTLNPVVLDNVRRKNIPVEQYDALRRQCEERGIDTYSELIYGLAGESDDSYIEGVIATIREGQRVTMYPQLLLAGSESGERAYRERFGLKTALRIIPRFVGSFGDLHSLEYDEIVVEHNDMTRDGYFRIRLFQFLVILLSGQAFEEFRKALRRAGLDHGSLARIIVDDRPSWTPGLRWLLGRLLEGAKRELIDPGERKLHFTADDIRQVKTGQLALIPHVLCELATSPQMLFDLREYLRAQVGSAFGCRILPAAGDELAACLAVAFDKLVCYDPLVHEKQVLTEYDFDAWLAAADQAALADYRHSQPVPVVYRLDPGIAEAVLETQAMTASLADALYRVRLNIIGNAFGDKVFCYGRVSEAAERRDRKAAVNTAHANLAARS